MTFSYSPVLSVPMPGNKMLWNSALRVKRAMFLSMAISSDNVYCQTAVSDVLHNSHERIKIGSPDQVFFAYVFYTVLPHL